MGYLIEEINRRRPGFFRIPLFQFSEYEPGTNNTNLFFYQAVKARQIQCIQITGESALICTLTLVGHLISLRTGE